MARRKTTRRLADELSDKLLSKGFVVHRYDSYSTNSIYLKLDYGACWSVRISDHPGYKHLKYRWNIGSWIKERRSRSSADGKYQRHFFPENETDALVERIEKHKRKLVDRIGESGYRVRMLRGEEEKHSAKSGFWAHESTIMLERNEHADKRNSRRGAVSSA